MKYTIDKPVGAISHNLLLHNISEVPDVWLPLASLQRFFFPRMDSLVQATTWTKFAPWRFLKGKHFGSWTRAHCEC